MRLYNLLLHLYPASFRNEYADEMRPLFERERKAARGFGIAGLWLGIIGDMLVNAAGAHLDILKQDLSYTGRLIERAPGFAATAVLIVALGIGATTATFSVTDFVLFRPLPFPEPDRLVKVWEKTPGYGRMEFSAPNYRDWKAAARSYTSMGIFHGDRVTWVVAGEPRVIRGAAVSADLLPTLGVSPVIGRSFTADDDRPGAARTLIVSHRFWQFELGGDPLIVGRTLVFDNAPCTVIGVMPRDFNFPRSDTQFWQPLRFDERAYADSERTNNLLNAVGRLRPGVTLEQARAEMEAIAARSALQFPQENKDTSAAV